MTDGEVAEAYRAMYRGTLERDTALLDDLLADDAWIAVRTVATTF